MSGDVQPRKRKDKKRKKDDLGIEEPRGTAAVFGEGDVFMHSQHEHGTGGHWCAKIIFFSLLAVLITLIGLIILENRGLTELEANSVESRYSGVLEGWLEDAPDDDHHDEHTLELNHPDDEDDHRDVDEVDHNEEDEHNDDDNDHDDEEIDGDENTDEDEDNEDDDQQDDEEDEEQNIEESDEDEEERTSYKKYFEDNEDQEDDDDDEEGNNDDDAEDNDDLQAVEENDSHEIDLNQYVDDNESDENNNEDDIGDDKNDDENSDEEDEDHEEEVEDTEVELEKIERELPDEEPISTELPALPEEDIDDGKSQEASKEIEASREENDADDEIEEFLETDEDELPIERITAPAGKPYIEVEEEVSSEQPPDSLTEEEEYEKQQEELRREKEKSSHMWLKLSGGALLVATHAVIRRATAPRDEPATEELSDREETPLLDRRMTLIPEEIRIPAPKTIIQESYQPIETEVFAQKITPQLTPTPPPQEELEEEEEKQSEDEDIEPAKVTKEQKDKQLYSDEEELEEEDEEVIDKKETPKESAAKVEEKPVPKPEPEVEDDPDDVEIIDDEQLDEELEEEEEDDISDVDDVELLTRLEAKYGRLPEPERPGQKHKDGGNSIEDEWPGEPSDAFWRQELDSVEDQLRQGSWAAAVERATAATSALRESARARWLLARAMDSQAEARRDNGLLSRAITAYIDLLKMNERLSDSKLLEVTTRVLDRIKFRGTYLRAEPVYRLLIRRFPEEPAYRNNLTISFLMANSVDLAEEELKETLKRWPEDKVALAHYGFILKTKHNRLEEALNAFQKALEGDAGLANEPRFYYHYGDTLLLLGRHAEAYEVHKKGAALGHFLSPAQRSLYNVPRLRSQSWWDIEKTPYVKLARALENSWKDILREGKAAAAVYEEEKEGLRERGEWSQLDLFVRGQEVPNRCKRAPVTCSIVRAEAAAVGCRRGQIKFSSMEPGTHVRPHVGPTNCRLRMHLGLSNTKDTFIRVDKITRQWQVGKVFMFDDSFEHEVWHNGTGTRLVLIVDVWHPDLTAAERRTLPAI
ncbi:LOW QUALITY PROTEIN: aspartyl beta-hydroxylase [Aphomia sociella]